MVEFDMIFGHDLYGAGEPYLTEPITNISAPIAEKGVANQTKSGPEFFVKVRRSGTDEPWVTYRAKPSTEALEQLAEINSNQRRA